MSSDLKRFRGSGMQGWRAYVGSMTLVFVVYAVVAATPVGFGTGDGSFALSWHAAYAGNKGKGGNGGNGGNGSNNGGGNTGGNTVGNGGGTSASNAAGNGTPSGAAGSGGGSDRHHGPALIAAEGVVVAQFTTQISKRQPANQVSLVSDPHQAVSFFTQLAGMQGHSITHRWIHDGVIEYQASFKVNGPNWRVWSTQLLPVDKPGDWRVEVVDDTNKVLQTGRLDYRPTG